MKEIVVEYLKGHPAYIPFLMFNVYIIYRVILLVLKDEDGNDDGEDDDNGFLPDGPDLDLPPGVSLPVDSDLIEQGV